MTTTTLRTARDVMNEDIYYVDVDMTVSEVAQFLTDHEISGTVVCSERSKPCGVISLTDLAAAAARSSEQPTARPKSGFYEESWEDALDEWDSVGLGELPTGELKAEDVMSTELIKVPADASVSTIARVMLENHVHRVLVEDDQGLIGLVSTSDLLRVLAEDT